MKQIKAIEVKPQRFPNIFHPMFTSSKENSAVPLQGSETQVKRYLKVFFRKQITFDVLSETSLCRSPLRFELLNRTRLIDSRVRSLNIRIFCFWGAIIEIELFFNWTGSIMISILSILCRMKIVKLNFTSNMFADKNI